MLSVVGTTEPRYIGVNAKASVEPYSTAPALFYRVGIQRRKVLEVS